MTVMSDRPLPSLDALDDDGLAGLAAAVLAELIARKNLCVKILEPLGEFDAEDVYMSVSTGLGQVQLTVFNDPGPGGGRLRG